MWLPITPTWATTATNQNYFAGKVWTTHHCMPWQRGVRLQRRLRLRLHKQLPQPGMEQFQLLGGCSAQHDHHARHDTADGDRLHGSGQRHLADRNDHQLHRHRQHRGGRLPGQRIPYGPCANSRRMVDNDSHFLHLYDGG